MAGGSKTTGDSVDVADRLEGALERIAAAAEEQKEAMRQANATASAVAARLDRLITELRSVLAEATPRAAAAAPEPGDGDA